jgi:hypothetical protein
MKRVFLILALVFSGTSVLALNSSPDSGSKYNFRFSPINLLVGSAVIALDFQLNDQWTLGPELSYWNASLTLNRTTGQKIDVNMSSIGARANWFKNGIYTDGFYIGPFARYSKTSINATGSTTITGDASGVTAGSLFGYGWFWESFNMMLGGGGALATGQSTLVVTDSSGNRTEVPDRGIGLALEYTLGWTF